MRFPSYSSALSWLYARNQFAMKLGLEQTRGLLEALGNPERGGVYLHVAGTNGKGSVCVAVAAMLPVVGVKRVGLYTSPHLVSFRERIRVDGAPVPAGYVTNWLNRYIEILETLNPTYFEIVTALAFSWFRHCGCEAVVLETGLGGRLDATNVIAPRVTVVTSVSLDHTALLGDTPEAIQREKLGIVKPGAPLIVDEDRPVLVTQAEDAARAAESVFVNLADRLTVDPIHGTLSVRGQFREYRLPSDIRAEDYQKRNAALAVLALEAWHGTALPPEGEWIPTLRGARMPGRMQRLAAPGYLPVLLDGAHNPDALEALRAALVLNPFGQNVRTLRIFFSVMSDKDYSGLITTLYAISGDLVFVDLSASNPRALPATVLRAAWPTAVPPETLRVINPTPEALEPLLRTGSGADATLFCGSLYLLGAVIPHLAAHYPGLEEFEKLKAEDESESVVGSR
jgi:dihydrofolate synthase/folylpolyglutamate synthase